MTDDEREEIKEALDDAESYLDESREEERYHRCCLSILKTRIAEREARVAELKEKLRGQNVGS